MADRRLSRHIEVAFHRAGFCIHRLHRLYSWLLANWVFVVTNGFILVTAMLGQWVYLRNKRPDGGPVSNGRYW